MGQAVPKVSAVIKQLADSIRHDPAGLPTAEAAAVSILFAHVAWNRSIGRPLHEANYRPKLEELEQANPELWNELADNDAERMIARLVALKKARYPHDERLIQLCEMRGGSVHVEWYTGEDVRDSDRIATEHLARLFELLIAGDENAAVEHLCQTTGLPPAEAQQHMERIRDHLQKRPKGLF